MTVEPFVLSAFTMSTVSHGNFGLWRHPDDRTAAYTDVRYWVELAKLLDRGGFDVLFIADAVGQLDVFGGDATSALTRAIQTPVTDPLLAVSAIAAATDHLGFGITVSTTYEAPYLLARKFSTLDHLTGGRIGWNIVTSLLDSAARNIIGRDRQIPHDQRYCSSDLPMPSPTISKPMPNAPGSTVSTSSTTPPRAPSATLRSTSSPSSDDVVEPGPKRSDVAGAALPGRLVAAARRPPRSTIRRKRILSI